MWLDEDFQLRSLSVLGRGRSEREILEEFSGFVDGHRPALVTYNGRKFDLPVVALRSLRHSVQMPWYFQNRGSGRVSDDDHVDLYDWLADHGAARSGSLDALARLVGLPGKLGVDGSQIDGLFAAGKLEQIENYCLADVVQTALLFLRFRLLQGVIDRDRHFQVVADLLDRLRRDPRLGDLIDALDERQLFALVDPDHGEARSATA